MSPHSCRTQNALPVTLNTFILLLQRLRALHRVHNKSIPAAHFLHPCFDFHVSTRLCRVFNHHLSKCALTSD